MNVTCTIYGFEGDKTIQLDRGIPQTLGSTYQDIRELLSITLISERFIHFAYPIFNLIQTLTRTSAQIGPNDGAYILIPTTKVRPSPLITPTLAMRFFIDGQPAQATKFNPEDLFSGQRF